MKVVWEDGGCAMVLIILIVDGTENSSRARFWSKTILINHPLVIQFLFINCYNRTGRPLHLVAEGQLQFQVRMSK